ncbi:MAG TPA: hypothetical protein VN207_10925 [Ktedonobacteraceae bacterium]|nr:hypothetical protein [Ktedonobacteraceae bacterium]
MIEVKYGDMPLEARLSPAWGYIVNQIEFDNATLLKDGDSLFVKFKRKDYRDKTKGRISARSVLESKLRNLT